MLLRSKGAAQKSQCVHVAYLVVTELANQEGKRILQFRA